MGFIDHRDNQYIYVTHIHILLLKYYYSSPPPIRSPLLPNNTVLIREVHVLW